MTVRRWFAVRKRRRLNDIWPILPGSERHPAGWPGWPDGRQFAFVLTHDVEGPDGLARVRPLAELEMSLGFRSSFNFIPEGDYRVSEELRAWLVSYGFEVGVHDLYHDGRLFASRERFREHARKINHYLKEWNATGFRAGFMLHNLAWQHDLNVLYDASTFDTDPFEPQPDGVGTIFPFWVTQKQKAENREQREETPASGFQPQVFSTSPSGTTPSPNFSPQPSDFSSQLSAFSFPRPGYVELPYTLPQDVSLFLLLQEPSIAIWRTKLDWIAGHGGMALVNVHPDYLRFLGDPPSSRTFPVELYAEFLQYVRKQHRPSFWQPLPKEVAAFAAPLQLPLRPKPKRICMVTHSFYESDNRVVRYAEALADRGDQVDVLALQRTRETPREETIRGVHVVRLQPRFGKKEQNHLDFLLPILRFGAFCWWWITRHYFFGQRHDLFHIHNIPDFLVFTAWVPRLAGTPVLLDIHDIVPEFYASKFGARRSRLVLPLLRWMERLSAAFAHHVIIANDLWVQRYADRTGTGRKCSVFINHVDSKRFALRPRTRNDNKLIVLFPGGLQWHQGLDIAIRAFQKVRVELSNAEFHIYGDGNMKDQLMQLSSELGLKDSVRFFEPLSVGQIAEVMANADLGVVPKRADSFGNEAYSTKIMEFMSLGIPVVVSSTKIDRYYFNDSVVRFFESGNINALAEAMIELLGNRTKCQEMVAHARAYAAQNSWESRKSDYLNLVDDLCAKK
jgi:glycosyltransferase involved in cell wall biosynthesis